MACLQIFLCAIGGASAFILSDNSRDKVCYEGYGCFTNSPPFDNSLGFLPDSPSKISTQFLLYTRETGDLDIKIPSSNLKALKDVNLDGSKAVKLIIHGFKGNGGNSWIQLMTTELLKKDDFTVFVVDWGNGAKFPYNSAAANARLVGMEVASLLLYLNKEYGTRLSDVHIIGHSLGAHVAGYAGHEEPKIGRITGLDPADPNFKERPPIVRLDPGDAVFVDVIHSDAAPFRVTTGFGIAQPIGDVDFYVNGGSYQPGCPTNHMIHGLLHTLQLKKPNMKAISDRLACSHMRAIYLFIESINSDCQFTSFPCDSKSAFYRGECTTCGSQRCPQMGYETDKNTKHGLYYLATMDSKPFCARQQFFVEIKFSHSTKSSKGRMWVQVDGSSGQVVKSGEFRVQRGEPSTHVYTDVIASRAIGTVESVTLVFKKSLYLLWFGSKLKIDWVKVTEGGTDTLEYFCTDETYIYNREELTLRQKNTSPC